MKKNITSCEFDLNVFDIDIVKKASYKFTDKVSFDFKKNEKSLSCKLSLIELEKLSKDGSINDIDIHKILLEFKNEVIDQDLRKQIYKETENVRNLILAKAFSNTDITNE